MYRRSDIYLQKRYIIYDKIKSDQGKLGLTVKHQILLLYFNAKLIRNHLFEVQNGDGIANMKRVSFETKTANVNFDEMR
jgi:hypothetical protein